MKGILMKLADEINSSRMAQAKGHTFNMPQKRNLKEDRREAVRKPKRVHKALFNL